jgi:peptidyl-prolyl isomerase G (cyclophilin G)
METSLKFLWQQTDASSSLRFFITLAPCEHLNAKHTVFGHMISGQEVLERIAKVPVDRKDRPRTDITIARCGELDSRQKPSTSADMAPRAKTQAVTRPRSPRPSRDRRTAHRASATSSSSRSRSPPHLRSRSPHRHRDPRRHPRSPPRRRRRSDVALDETRRGRSLTRSPSPETWSSRAGTNRLAQQQQQQQHHRHANHRKRSPPPSRPHSRPRSRSPHLRRRRTRSRSPRDHGRRGERDIWRRREESKSGEKRGEPTVQFKGRGSMKYRERKW